LNEPDTAFDPPGIVEALYRGLLGREAEPEGLRTHTERLRANRDLLSLLQDFTNSSEYKARSCCSPPPSFGLDGAPPMRVQTSCGPEERLALWSHIASVWSAYGETDPYWSVMTNPRWRAANMSNAKALSDFHATGEGDALRLDAWLRRNALFCDADAVCAEYGTGVGRVTSFLAGRFRRVITFDVSRSHLNIARDHLEGKGVHNVEYVLVRGEMDLERLTGIDVFYSILVLQHNPPPIMEEILDRAFDGLRPGGAAFFQIPTYSRDYAFSCAEHLSHIEKETVMEMHFLPQQSVFELGRRHDVFPLEIEPDWCIGHHDRWISSTFLMAKLSSR
jgi:SAM-dependent methyltransferase